MRLGDDKKVQRGFSVILVLVGVLAIVLVGGGAFILSRQTISSKIQSQVNTQKTDPQISPSPSADETANWKTFKNDDFYFQYPEGCKVNFVNRDVELNGNKKSCPLYSLSIRWNDNKNYTNDFLVGYFISEMGKGSDGFKLNKDQVNVSDYKTNSGLIFKKMDIRSDFFYTDLLILKNNKIYWIRLIPGIIGYKENIDNPKIALQEKIFKQIVNSFKFN